MSLGICLLSAAFAMSSDIKSDEEVVFYPTSAYQDTRSGQWTVPFHGIIFEPEESSLKRRALISLLRRNLDLDRDDERSEIFRERISKFLVDNERGNRIVVRIGTRDVALDKSGPNGHFHGSLTLSDAEARRLLDEHGSGDRWVKYAAVVKDSEERTFAGRVQFVEPKGISVISDIDDTIKISKVTDRKELLRNTFLRPFVAVPGMAARYQAWAKKGAVVHYLSASPWQLYEALKAFRQDAKFPAGSFQLRKFRLKDASALDFLASSAPYKTQAIDDLLTAFPRRQFAFVGDSGENDPEIFAAAYRKHPGRVARIMIRNVTEANRDDARFRKAMKAVPADRWQLFDKADELDDLPNAVK